MELKRAKVIMLSQKNEATFYENNGKRYQIDPIITNKKHLYFITDDEIKEGDWWVNTAKGNIQQINEESEESIKKYNGYSWCKKIVATTDKSLGLPEPSEAFIQKYCEIGGIDEVDIEYELCINLCGGFCGHGKGCPYGGKDTLFLKVNSHNTITIHPIKNSWSREELQFLKGSTGNHLEFIYKRLIFVHKEDVNYDYILKLKEIVDWVDKNLK